MSKKCLQDCEKKYNFDTVCRICLAQDTKYLKNLGLPIFDENESEDSPLIFEVIGDIMDEKVVKVDGYPSGVCDICLAVLSAAYNLQKQYFKSKKLLENVFASSSSLHHNTFYESERFSSKSTDTNNVGLAKNRKKKLAYEQVHTQKIEFSSENKRFYFIKQPLIQLVCRAVQTEPTDMKEVKIDDKKSMPSVELFLGETSYDIKDLVIVEDKDPEKDDCGYEGFLQNLGSVVSATFACREQIAKNSEKRTEIEITPLSKVVDIGALKPLEDLASDPVKMSFTCRHCKKSFDSSSYIKKHIRICEKFKNLQCYVCDVQTANIKDLFMHVKNTHSIGKQLLGKHNMMDADETMLKCKICSKVLANMRRLSYHMLRHKGHQFACEECGKTFLTIHLLNNHKISAHQNKTVEVCPVCAKTFTYKGGMMSHMKLHSDELNYECSFCSKKFRFHYAKTAHERTHTGEKPYICKFCEKRFRRHSDWKKHERSVHTGERPHKCQLCSLAFVTKTYLKRHMLQHEGDFVCQVCKKSFVNSEILELHLKTKHTITITDENQRKIIIEERVQEFEDFENCEKV